METTEPGDKSDPPTGEGSEYGNNPGVFALHVNHHPNAALPIAENPSRDTGHLH